MRTKNLAMTDQEIDLSIKKINSSEADIRVELHRLSSTQAYKHKGCNSMRDLNRKYLGMDQSTMYREIRAAVLEVLLDLKLNSLKASVLVQLSRLKNDEQKREVWEFVMRMLRKLRPHQTWPTAKQIAHVIAHFGYGKPPKDKAVNEEKVAKKIKENIGLLSNAGYLRSVILAARDRLDQSR